MENQINVGDKNTEQMEQKPVRKTEQVPEKPKVNYWMISSLIFGLLFFSMVGVNWFNSKTTEKKNDSVIPLPQPSTKSIDKVSRFTGSVQTGTQLGEVKSHCSNGLYLVADEGTYLADQTTMLQLHLPKELDGTKMLSDQQYVGKLVEVVGKYPAQEIFCEALICECEDYILVDRINIVDTESIEKRQTKTEGQIDCLPQKDTSGGQTLECTFGLQGKDGIYYGLQGLNQRDLISGKIAPGQKVVITGIFTPGQDSKYNTIGTIKVAAVEYAK